MFLPIHIPAYEGAGIQVFGEENSRIQLVSNTDCVNIIGTRPAFYSLAKQMLYFCYNTLPDGAHVHFDDFFCRSAWFGKGLTIELTESSPHGINSASTQNGQTVPLEIPEPLTTPLWHEDSQMRCFPFQTIYYISAFLPQRKSAIVLFSPQIR